MRPRHLAIAGVAVVAMPAIAAGPCDRACLTDKLDTYLAALASHDRGRLLLGDTVRTTENGQAIAIGDGLWGTATRIGTYRHDFADPATGQIATFTTVWEGETHSILVARLRIARGRIDEIETVVARPAFGGAGGAMDAGADRLDASGTPEPLWTADVPFERRASRAELIRTANKYFAGLQRNDGHGDYPFSDDCLRIENGFRTTSQSEAIALPGNDKGPRPYAYDFMRLGCKAQFQQGYYRFIDRIRDRRFVVVDEARGAVFSFVFFDHRGTTPTVTLTDGKVVPTGLAVPFTWELGEAFKITHGEIRRVEAAMTQAPYAMPPNWPVRSGEQAAQ